MERYNPFELRTFIIPEFMFGSGSIEMVDMCIKDLGASKVLVVTDPGVIAAGWTEIADRLVKNTGIPFSIFSEVTSNPRDTQVTAGTATYRKEKCDLILAVGGGSVLDCAKGIAASCSGMVSINEFEGEDLVPLQVPPLVCIPTTAGTSSDISQFAMITRDSSQRKFVVKSRKILPRISLIDSITTTTLPPELTSATGMCALANAFEAFVSSTCSPVTDADAVKAVNLISHNLVPAIEHHYDLRYRDRMMLASLFAGRAFSNTGPGLIHAISNAISGLIGLSHGMCCSMLFEHIIRFSFYSAADRYTDLARAMGIDTEGMGPDRVKDALANEISSLKHRAGISYTLRTGGVTQENLPKIAVQAAGYDCIKTGPRAASAPEIESILRKAL